MFFDGVLLITQLPGSDAGKPDVGGAAKEAAKKSPLGFMNMGDLALDLPGSNVSKGDLPNDVKPGDAAGLPKGPTAKPPSGPSLPKVRHAAPAQNRTGTHRHKCLKLVAACIAPKREIACAKHSTCRLPMHCPGKRAALSGHVGSCDPHMGHAPAVTSTTADACVLQLDLHYSINRVHCGIDAVPPSLGYADLGHAHCCAAV